MALLSFFLPEECAVTENWKQVGCVVCVCVCVWFFMTFGLFSCGCETD
jgi:hypothetical protein